MEQSTGGYVLFTPDPAMRDVPATELSRSDGESRSAWPGRWTAVLDHRDARLAKLGVRAILRDCRSLIDEAEHCPEGSSAGLVAALNEGAAGWALMYSYAGLALRDPGACDQAVRAIDAAIDIVDKNPTHYGLFSGFAGVGWVVGHLQGRLLQVEEEVLAGIDEAILDLLKVPRWTGHFDLLKGLIGLGVYALERYPCPAAVEILERVIARLADWGEEQSTGISWWIPPTVTRVDGYPDGCWNLGVAHGQAGMIGFLAQVHPTGVARSQVERLLHGAVDWLLARELPAGSRASFGHCSAPGQPERLSRLSWCYGELSTAVVLWNAARSTGNRRWREKSLELALCAARRDPDDQELRDAGLCHGFAGVGHLFNRIFQATGDLALAEAARFWFRRTLRFRREDWPLGGFKARSHPDEEADEEGFVARSCLLEGSPGVALALIAAATDLEPEWDRCFLLSVPGVEVPQ